MAFELTEQIENQVPGLREKYRARIEQMGYTLDWFESASLAIRVTPERAWTI